MNDRTKVAEYRQIKVFLLCMLPIPKINFIAINVVR